MVLPGDPCKRDDGPNVLLVEGKNDCHVVMALCEAHGVPESFGIYECGSDEKLLRKLNALILRPDPLQHIGVVLDADKLGVLARWRQIQGKLKRHGYTFPNQPDEAGTVIAASPEGVPRLGFWLMPNNRDAGMLEGFCARMSPEPELKFAEECVATAQDKGFAAFKEVHRAKAVIHTYLAWQDEPGQPLGRAVTTKALQHDSPTALLFVSWLTRLFPEAATAR